MFSRRAAAEVLSRDQNASASIPRIVEYKRRISLAVLSAAPVKKKKFPKSGALHALQKLLGNDLIRIDIHAIQRSHAPRMHTKRFHNTESSIPINGPPPLSANASTLFVERRASPPVGTSAFTETSNPEYR